ncbi:Sec23/Sec24 trunk domain-containing protein [Aphelenchoides besseyi]|nr:Sec23/Sec24 trunk domain-containing protein [Aphelenchoides besseyi]
MSTGFAPPGPPMSTGFAPSGPPMPTGFAPSNPPMPANFAPSGPPISAAANFAPPGPPMSAATGFAPSNPPMPANFASSGPPMSTGYAPPGQPMPTGFAPPGQPMPTGFAPSGPPMSAAAHSAPSGPPMPTGYAPPGQPMSTGFAPPGPPMSAVAGSAPSGPPMSTGFAPGPPMSTGFAPPGPPMSAAANFAPSGPPMPTGFAPPGSPMSTGFAPSGPPMSMGFAPPGPPMAGGFGQMQPPGMMQKASQRLDPAMMPSFIQVIEDDRSLHANTVFNTGFATAEVPPLITTDFIAADQGNSNPKFIRSSVYQVPANQDMIKNAMLPFTLSITPFAELDPREYQPPIIDLGELGPVRCQRCKAYISSFMEFVDGGRKFRCPFCQANTPIEDVYFAHLDHNGRRTDIGNRPELYLGSYEFVGTKHYCKNNIPPKEPAFVFLLDVSYNSVRSGLLDLFCNNLLDILRDLPKEFGAPKSSIKIALATYDQTIHFYDLDSGDKPKVCIESDVSEVFVPFIEGFFVDFETAEANLTQCLQDVRKTFADTRVTETILGPAIAVGLDALKAANRNGKIFVFHTNLPTVEAPGRLKNREDRKLLGTDKEKTILTEGTDFYKKLGIECVKNGICTDVFLFPNAHVDVASIAPVSRLSGGSVYKYQYFDAQKDGKRFLTDLHRDVSRPIVFDVMMRVRTSTGLRPVGYYGSFYMQDVMAIEIGAMDCDKSLQVEIKYDDKLNEQDRAYIQVATLFTSCGGQRRLRIHNLTLPVTSDHNANVSSHRSECTEMTVREKSPKEMKEEIVTTSAHILAAYREKCSENSPIGQLILPECLKLLPLMGNCIAKCEALSGGSEITVDDRAWMMSLIPSMRVDEAIRLLYPNVLPLTELKLESPEQQLDFPTPVRASIEFLQQNEAYIIENGLLCFVWVGISVPVEWIQDVFDARALDRLDTESGIIPERDNARSRAVRQVIERLNRGRSRQLKMHIVKPGDGLEAWMKKFLVEDRYAQNSPSYSVVIKLSRRD